MNVNNKQQDIQQQIEAAYADGKALRIIGGNSKAFYGCPVEANEILNVAGHQGVISYEPSELVLTARAGTSLHDIESLLAEHHQQLPFEPPGYNGHATLGGVVAAGLSGPARMYSGALRDAVLGVKIINGKGEVLSFGGQVMKNVAGFDVSRLMAGSLGTLGVILEVSVKTRPSPACEHTLAVACSASEALQLLQPILHMPVCLTASAWVDGTLWLRISGSNAAVSKAATVMEAALSPLCDKFKMRGRLNERTLSDQASLWCSIKNQQHAFFQQTGDLWRISLPQNAPLAEFPHALLMEWNGALRWLKTVEPAQSIRRYAQQHQGHATRFNHGEAQTDCFQPLEPGMVTLQKNIKQAFDPKGILNPGRVYTGKL